MRKNVLPGTYVLTRCKSQCCLEVGVCKSVSYALFDNFIKVFFSKSGFSQQFILCGVIKSQIAYWIRWAERSERLELN